ncbi:MAG TPA: response regulator [Gemmataceae bacterium]|nr:response regulator [Gemmataceae bacterium]
MNTGVIFLVEDNPDDVQLTLRAFKKNHILNRVVVARDGEEALNYLFGPGAAAHEVPAVMLLDLKLPKIDGLEVLRKVRADPRTRLLRVVVLTSSREDQDVVQSYASGANSYIRKPVDFDAFMTAVGQLGLYWLLLNETPPEAAP